MSEIDSNARRTWVASDKYADTYERVFGNKHMKIKPLHKYIIIESERETETGSGIVLVKKGDDYPEKGKVIEKGNSTEIKNGDTVIFKRYSAVPVEIDKKKILIVDERDIQAII